MRASLLLALLLLTAPARAQETDARTLFQQGLAHADEGDDVRAERAFRESLAMRWSVSAAYNLALVLARHGDFEEAATRLREVVEHGDTPAQLREQARTRLREVEAQAATAQDAERRERAEEAVRRAEAARAQNDLIGAREGYTQALELTGNPEHRFALAEIEDALGNREAARAHYQAYVDGGPAGERRDRAVTWLGAGVEPDPPEPVPEPVSSGGVDGVALGVTLGVGLAVTGVFAALAGVWFDRAQQEYTRLEGSCVDMCSDDDLTLVRDELTLTNVFLATSIAAAALTALGVVLVIALPGGDEEVAVGPGFVRAAF